MTTSCDKCTGCIFAGEAPYEKEGWYFPICTREDDFIESVNAREDKEPCPWHITIERIIALQNEGLL